MSATFHLLVFSAMVVGSLQATNYTLAMQTVPLNGGSLIKYCVKTFSAATVKPYSTISAASLDSSNCVDFVSSNKAYEVAEVVNDTTVNFYYNMAGGVAPRVLLMLFLGNQFHSKQAGLASCGWLARLLSQHNLHYEQCEYRQNLRCLCRLPLHEICEQRIIVIARGGIPLSRLQYIFCLRFCSFHFRNNRWRQLRHPIYYQRDLCEPDLPLQQLHWNDIAEIHQRVSVC